MGRKPIRCLRCRAGSEFIRRRKCLRCGAGGEWLANEKDSDMARRKTLGDICGDAFDAARKRGLTYPECNEAAAAAVEREVLRRLHESDRRRANTKKPKH